MRQRLYILGGCYYDNDDGDVYYYVKGGKGDSPEGRAYAYGMELLGVVNGYWNTDEGALLAMLEGDLGKNPGARYQGAGRTECYGKIETREEQLEYVKELINDMQMIVIERRIEEGRPDIQAWQTSLSQRKKREDNIVSLVKARRSAA